MSLSRPSNRTPNPATRHFEWKGKDGHLQYYDKEAKENVIVKLPFKFLLLDRLATVTGYNKKLKSGIYSNEVRDTRSDPFIVKVFSGGIAAEGVWAEIKDKVTSRAMGGCFASNCYIAFRDGKELALGALKLSGCALGPWFEFEKLHRKTVANPFAPDGKRIEELHAKAIVINKGKPNEEGEIAFVPPLFSLVDKTAETHAAAMKLDDELQEYLDGYFARTHVARVETDPAEAAQLDTPEDEPQTAPAEDAGEPEWEIPSDDVPF